MGYMQYQSMHAAQIIVNERILAKRTEGQNPALCDYTLVNPHRSGFTSCDPIYVVLVLNHCGLSSQNSS